ncbi:MAG: caspase family protein [Cytophagales bacterium]|nr:caspase family protein [Cytophagales bacterium]
MTYGTALYEESCKKENHYALLIGIDAYEDDEIQDLDEPVSDVEKLNNVLHTDYSFLPENTTVLKNPTRDNIIDAFDVLNKKVTAKDPTVGILCRPVEFANENMKQGYWLPTRHEKRFRSRGTAFK